MNKTELLASLHSTKSETLQYFQLPQSDLLKSYGPGKWNIRQILNHLTDAETVLYDRLRRVIAKPGQVIWAFDQEAWAKQLAYKEFPLSINEDIFRSVRTSVIYLAECFYEPLGDHSFIHSQTGKRSLRDEFEKVAWHNQGHIDQIRQALQA